MILIHYGEIGLKGKNRITFENRLQRNVQRALGGRVEWVRREYGRIIAQEGEDVDYQEITGILQRIPGIENFSFARMTPLDMGEIIKAALALAGDSSFSSFKIAAKRGNKSFPHTSMQVNEIVGEVLQKELNKRVDLEKPDLTVFIEISTRHAYVYATKFYGIGGLPTGSEGKVVSLLSGGIDSPVASWMMMKRGCEVVFLHFYNEDLVGAPKKIEELISHLTSFQLSSKAYFIPFGEFQREVIRCIPARFRMVVYRRFMTKIADAVAQKEGAQGVVTGDSVGQVASQTLENIHCIHAASSMPVFSPLIGLNKKEIVELAQTIGTYDISIKPYDDCCSFMVAKHPVVRAHLDEIEELEEKLTSDARECIAHADIRTFNAD